MAPTMPSRMPSMIAATRRRPKLARGPEGPVPAGGWYAGCWYEGSVMVSPWGSEEREAVQLEEPARREDGWDHRLRQSEPRRAQDEQGEGGEHEHDAERVRRERVAEVEANRLLDARREAAERARQAAQRAERAVEARVPGQHGEHQPCREHRPAGDPQVARVEEHRSTPSHGATLPAAAAGGKLSPGVPSQRRASRGT